MTATRTMNANAIDDRDKLTSNSFNTGFAGDFKLYRRLRGHEKGGAKLPTRRLNSIGVRFDYDSRDVIFNSPSSTSTWKLSPSFQRVVIGSFTVSSMVRFKNRAP